jgi:hypothetical protein
MGLFSQLQYALNTIWEVPPATYAGTIADIKNRLLAFVMVLGLALLLILATFASFLVSIFGSWFDWAGSTPIATQVALEQFLRFDNHDLAARDYLLWWDTLDEPLPQHTAGAEATLQLLRDEVILHGSRIGAPGFAGWVTTASKVVPAAAALSASLAVCRLSQ